LTFRVHVVFTGGTIGSSTGTDSTDLVAGQDRQILSYAPTATEFVFTTSEPFRILSEDADLDTWSLLACHVSSLPLESIDAVVVAHGSDTLAWSAKALSYALAGVPVPVVVIGSDKPLTHRDSNGPDHFRDALLFAATEKLPGIYAAWKNPGEPTAIHLASRLLPCDVHDDHFRSARGLHFGTVSNGEFRRNAVEGNPSRSHLAKIPEAADWKETAARAQSGVLFDPDLLVIPAMPGIDAEALAGGHRWKAVLQLAYHSGTAPSFDATGSLLRLAKKCQADGIPLVVGPARESAAPYASVSRLREAGAVFAPNMTEASLVVKLRWLLGTGQDLSGLSRSVGFDLLGGD